MDEELYFPFEDLDVYKHARALVKSTYILIEKFPYTERNGLSDQLRRAIVSVPSNIAEGLGRISDKEKIHFLEISYSSLMESLCQLQLARDLEYITEEELCEKRKQIKVTSKLLSGLRLSYIKKNKIVRG